MFEHGVAFLFRSLGPGQIWRRDNLVESHFRLAGKSCCSERKISDKPLSKVTGMTDDPILGVFDPEGLKKRPWIRERVLACVVNDSRSSYPYEEMLEHATAGRCADQSRRINVPMIEVARTSKKTTILNFATICQHLRRDEAHVKHYLCTEQNLEASQDSNGALICKGRLTHPQLEKLISDYYAHFVKCPVCQSSNTHLTKQNRLLFIVCKSCTAQRSIQQIKQGFVTQTSRRNRRVAPT
jgi:translation initiation factor 2 subunit 2